MHQRSLSRQTVSHAKIFQNESVTPTQPASPTPSSGQPPRAVSVPDELARTFNTILVSSRAKSKRDYSKDLFELAESSPFKAILSAVKQLARVQGITERQATEQVIHTFRKMDELWGEYVFHEGIDRLRGQR